MVVGQVVAAVFLNRCHQPETGEGVTGILFQVQALRAIAALFGQVQHLFQPAGGIDEGLQIVGHRLGLGQRVAGGGKGFPYIVQKGIHGVSGRHSHIDLLTNRSILFILIILFESMACVNPFQYIHE